ncbi:hypothetical protein AMAG_14463 [Allomyces macrogynus ATCC 38327]|uniref:G-protein coupled receptors family 3 profile domain-containing protein n=1 Tax=Allomyces macrogynus (strain ATCC 38327) TaxID=578462 RepID=A0A0L0T695_ALLM3|nr:hypothetical protein AMAG_14463 [Allomyces macrogynus ATCC 38327]|eukprot:KNE70318.1 hypothetical protein AMAG_14463 [Allomyces macrogynus ATCC 38327]
MRAPTVVLVLILGALLGVILIQPVQATPPTVRVLLARLNEDATYESQVLDTLFTPWMAQNGIRVEYHYYATLSSSSSFGAVQSYLDAHDPYYDLYMLDVVWPGALADHLADVTPYLDPVAVAQHDPKIVAAGVVGGSLFAMPAFVDFGVLYYRADLLQRNGFASPPETWDEMHAMLTRILPVERVANPALVGYMGQLQAYEGLTCNVIEWLAGASAGSIIEPNRTLSGYLPGLTSSRVVAVAQRMRSWLKSGLIGPLAVNADETVSRTQWVQGNAVFVRHWPSLGAATHAVNVSFAWNMTRMPGDKREDAGAAALGGWFLAVSKYSMNIEAAARVLQFMTSRGFQRVRAVRHGVMPSVPALFDGTHSSTGRFGRRSVSPRPSAPAGAKYVQASTLIYTAWSSILLGQAAPATALADMNRNLASTLDIDILGRRTNVEWTDTVVEAVASVAAAGGILVAATAVRIMRLLTHPEMKKASPVFLGVTLAGIGMAFAAVPTYVGVPTVAVCAVQPWLLASAFSVAIGAVTVRNFRIYRIFSNPFASTVVLRNHVLFVWLAGILAVDVILLAIWTAFDAPVPTDVKLAASRYTTCRSKDAQFQTVMVALLYFSKAALLLFSLWLAAQTRAAGGGYSESKSIAFAIYNLTLVLCIGLPLAYTDALGQPFQFAMRALAIILPATGLLGALFAPKLVGPGRIDKPAPSASVEMEPPLVSFLTKRAKGKAPAAAPVPVPAAALAALNYVKAAVVSYRSARSTWRLRVAPWHGAQMLLLPQLGIVVLEPLDPSGKDPGRVIKLAHITRVVGDAGAPDTSSPAASTTGSGADESTARLHVVLATGEILDVMLAGGAPARVEWVDALDAARRNGRRSHSALLPAPPAPPTSGGTLRRVATAVTGSARSRAPSAVRSLTGATSSADGAMAAMGARDSP